MICATEKIKRFYIQPVFGKMKLEEKDASVEGDAYDLTILGIAFQQPLNPPKAKESLQYGVEMGFVGSWENDVQSFYASSGPDGGTIAVQVQNSWFLGDLFFGGFASYNLGKWARIYVGAGPLLVYGRRHVTPEDDETKTTTVEDTVESGFGGGIYGRTGIEFYITKEYLVGACARAMTSNLTFNDPMGDIKVEGIQGLLTFTIKL